MTVKITREKRGLSLAMLRMKTSSINVIVVTFGSTMLALPYHLLLIYLSTITLSFLSTRYHLLLIYLFTVTLSFLPTHFQIISISRTIIVNFARNPSYEMVGCIIVETIRYFSHIKCAPKCRAR
ncbi:hypothetical protein OSB04_012328 [Centaurea solstitialis]|uniref:Uncharacterized protein n=1 Tax=Centaurea solstitialis TaxID=347529 RepID=A0AA38TB59_9ASTR|nr:hypothetical protein OSB04_012328 [Centaurea solstitialis]